MSERKNTGFWGYTILAGFSIGIGVFAVFLGTIFIGLDKSIANVANLAVIAVGQLIFGRSYAANAGDQGVTYLRSLGFMAMSMLFAAVLAGLGDMITAWAMQSANDAKTIVNAIMRQLWVIPASINLIILGILVGMFTSIFIYNRK